MDEDWRTLKGKEARYQFAIQGKDMEELKIQKRRENRRKASKLYRERKKIRSREFRESIESRLGRKKQLLKIKREISEEIEFYRQNIRNEIRRTWREMD